MQIERIFYPVRTLGYGKRIGIWTVGCPHGCFNCSNPELWEANENKDVTLGQLFEIIASIQDQIDGVTITGGDPFMQIEDLYQLVHYLREHITDDILVYTGFTFEELKERNDDLVDGVMKQIAVLIDGKYIEEQNDNRALRGSTNQCVHILNDAYRERYEPLLNETRQVQTVFYQQDLLSIGIPMKTYRKQMSQKLPEFGIHTEHARRGELKC